MENKFRGIKTEQQNHARGSNSSFNREKEFEVIEVFLKKLKRNI